jgi:hypothetical protein
MSRNSYLYSLRLLQAGWWAIFGLWGFFQIRRVYIGEDADCFWDVGAYQVCDATQQMSIFSSLFLLMTQALLSRILVPGKSNFVNASVSFYLRRLLARPCDTRFLDFAQRDRVEPRREWAEERARRRCGAVCCG